MEYMEPIEFARHLRQTATSYEELIWPLLRNRKRCHMKFRRQHPLGIYTADFYCAEAKLDIEIDGTHHFTDEGKRHDAARDRWMAEQGIRVLRFTDLQVEQEADWICAEIDRVLRQIESGDQRQR